MSDPPSVEALIVSFNAREELGETLRSLLEHRPPAANVELRVSVFDNASSDGSADMVAREFPQVNLVRSATNLGFGRANNALVRRSRSDYVLLLNSDVILTQDIATPLLQSLVSDPSAIAAGPRLVYPDGQVQYSAHRLPTLAYEFARAVRGRRLGRALAPVFDSQRTVDAVHEYALTDLRAAPRSPEFLWATCWLVRRADISREGIFDESFPMYDEDLDFCRRARIAGRTLRYVPDVELVHIGGASTGSSVAKQRLERRARHHYYRVHHGAAVAAVYRAVLPLLTRVTRGVDAIPPASRRGARAGAS